MAARRRPGVKLRMLPDRIILGDVRGADAPHPRTAPRIAPVIGTQAVEPVDARVDRQPGLLDEDRDFADEVHA
jgi:hypothetical protein